MHSEVRARLQRGGATTNRWLPRWLAVLFPCSIVGSVLGQSVLVPPPGFQGAPTVPAMGSVSATAGQPNAQVTGQANGTANSTVPSDTTGTTESASTEAGASAKPPLESLAEWGFLHVHARASYQFVYDTGLRTAPGKSTDTFTHTLSPGLTLQFGPHVGLDYSPSIRFFSEKKFHDTVDQSVSLNAGVHYGDWTFGLSQNFSLTDEPVVETAGQTEEKSYSAGLSASYQLNEKISFDTSASVALMFLNATNAPVDTNSPVPFNTALTDSQSYSGAEWINYKFGEKVSGGLGVTVSYSEQNSGFSSVSEQYQGRVAWFPGKKLSLSLSGGLQDQQFLDSGAKDLLTPIFSASVSYHLFEQTTLSLSGGRTVSTSLFQNQITENTQLGVGLQQRLLGKLQLSLGFGYNTTDYKDTDVKLVTARSDSGKSYSVGLSYPLWTRSTIAAFYQYNESSSSLGGFGFATSQIGATLSWAY